MPANFGVIQSRTQNLLGSNASISTSELQALIQAEHATILEDLAWAARKSEGTIATVATDTTGTVSTSGTTVTGSGTAWTSSYVGRWIRLGTDTAFYKITAFGSSTSLTIEAARPEGNLAAGAVFTVFQHVYSLASDAERLVSIVGGKGARYASKLQEITRDELDRLDPNRQVTGTWTSHFSLRERDSSNAWQVELWPVPSSAFLLRYEYLKVNSLSASTDIPLYRSDILVWKSAAAGAFLLYAKTGDQAWINLADRYEALYERHLKDAIMADLAIFSPARRIRDVEWASGPYLTNDWMVDHDSLGSIY